MRRLHVLALEPYYGGSHRAVLDLLVESVDAEWTLFTLPARKWKWRMRGAAITMAEQAAAASAEGRSFDVIFASTFLNLAEFRGLVPPRVGELPAVVYFHENQLSYPNRHAAEWDFQFPLTNLTSALSAEACVFNTCWNRDDFLRRVPDFLRGFPDHRPARVVERIAARSSVLAPPFDPRPFSTVAESGVARSSRCRIVWPHRWEHDKNPEEFLAVVGRLAAEGLDFEVVIAGQSFRETEGLMRDAALSLGDRLVACAEPESREQYARLLSTADVAVSTASNEFFGLAMIEACFAGCVPAVPDRLAYPEIYPDEYRYRDRDELAALLRSYVLERPRRGSARHLAEPFTIDKLADEYAGLLRALAESGR